MPIPDYQSLMLPLLRLASDGAERTLRQATAELAVTCKLSDEESRRVFPTSGQPVFRNRVGWAREYLKRAGLLEYPHAGSLRITARGREVMRGNPADLRNRDLMQYPEFRDFVSRKPRDEASTAGSAAAIAPAPVEVEESESPQERIESGYRRLREEVELELLTRTKAAPPEFFERLVVRLLVAMGYGGSLAEAGEAVGRTGDGGIDGVIREDRLGMGVIAVQAKRWTQGAVGRPDVQAFVGALHGRGTKKGVFITTASFSNDAQTYAQRLNDVKVVLVDGAKLAELMFDYGLGVALESEYTVKRIDSDFFDEAG